MKRPSHADQRQGRLRPALAASAAAAGSAVAFTALVAAVARRVVIPVKGRPADVQVDAADAETITMRATPDTVLPGRYGLWIGAHYARIGAIVARDEHQVTRRRIDADGTAVSPGPAAFSGWYFTDPAQLRINHENVVVETEWGGAPAWLFPPEDAATQAPWAVIVHGRGVQRAEVLRAVPVLHDAGFACLAVSYRNDGEGPRSPDGRYGLGDTEWRDVEAALDLAAARGAERVVLMGWSMGGAIVLQAARRSRHRSRIAGLILESPVVDWRTVLRYQARASRIPRPVRDAALWAISHAAGRILTGLTRAIDLDRLDRVAHADELDTPTLILHSDDDGFVPSDASHALARRRPDLVTLETFDVARHTKLWNYDEKRWTGAITAWLAAL